jgi:hypothetical protein
LLDPSPPEGAIATASHQTGGRGALAAPGMTHPARRFYSVLPGPPPERHPPELMLVGGFAVARALGPQAMIAAERR